MSENIVKVISIDSLTHDVNKIVTNKPDGYSFLPGQATEASINQPELKNEKRPFTFTSLNEWEHLEFTIKSYYDHNGVTKEIGELKSGDELIIRDVWGSINYKGKGVFIAGGAGVTPFIAILRDLNSKNKISGHKLIFSNKTADDIILKEEFSAMLGDNFINILTREKKDEYYNGRIDEKFLNKHIKDFNEYFYICGPKEFVKDIKNILQISGVENNSIILEK